MQLSKTDLIKIPLAENAGLLGKHQLTCWRKQEDKFNIYIFSTVFANEAALLENYEQVRDDIAIYFQSQTLTLDIERWNLYLFYFVGESVREDHKQKIQQDKFSMRKIVADRINPEITEVQIHDRIIRDLFTFEIGARIVNKESIKEFLEIENKEVMAFLKKDNYNSNEGILNALINQLGNG